jgi:dCTP deaminase
MILCDKHIRELCIGDKPMIEPFSEGVQDGVISYGLCSAGYDLRLGNKLLVFKNTSNEIIDPKRFKDETYRARVFDEVTPRRLGSAITMNEGYNCAYIIPPHSYALGVSLEYLRIPRHLKGRIIGKSTYARCGILINCTPAEPSWEGYLTIEVSNITPCPALIFALEGIAQMELEVLSSEPEVSYADKRGKYQCQPNEPVPARIA